MATPKNLVDLKEHMKAFLRLITEDKVMANDVRNFGTWFKYVHELSTDTFCTEQRIMKTYLYNEIAPKFLAHILRKNYVAASDFVEVVKSFLQLLARYLAMELLMKSETGDINEGVFIALKDLLDPTQPFFVKFGFPKIEQPKASAVAPPARPPFLDEIAVGFFVDFKTDAGVWTASSVSEVSPTSTEVKIQSMEGADLGWISLETSYNRFAPFFTASCDPSTVPEVPAVAPATADPVATASTTPPAAEDPSVHAWKNSFQAGDLIDAKHHSGVWYQALILQVESIEATCETTTVISAANGDNALAAAPPPLVADSQNGNSSVSDSALGILAAAATAPLPPDGDQDTGAAPMDISLEQATSLAVDVDGFVFVDEPRNLTGSDHHHLPYASNHSPSTDSTQSISSAATAAVYDQPSLTSTLRLAARVSFVGFPEKDDEWIFLDSSRIEALNVQSRGRRGENPVREEIVALAKYVSADNETESDIHACILRSSCFHAPAFFAVANEFARSEGFALLAAFVAADNDDVTTPPAASTSSGVQQVRPPLKLWLAAITAIGNSSSVFSEAMRTIFKRGFYREVISRFSNLSVDEIRNHSDLLEPALKALERLAVTIPQRLVPIVEGIRVAVGTNLLLCPILTKRLDGLRMLNELVHRGENKEVCPNGVRMTKTKVDPPAATNGNGSAGPKVDYNLSFSILPILRHVTLDILCDHIVNRRLIHNMFDGLDAHSSLMERSGDLLRVLVDQHRLDAETLNVVWDAAYHQRIDPAMQSLLVLIAHLPFSLLHHLLGNIASILDTEVNQTTVDLLCRIAKRTRSLLFDNGTGSDPADPVLRLHVQTLAKLRLYCLDTSQVPDAVVAYCQGNFEMLLGIGQPVTTQEDADKLKEFPWHVQWKRTEDIVAESIADLQQLQSIAPNLRLVMAFVSSWPVKAIPVASDSIGLPSVCCGDVVNHLERTYGLIGLVVDCVVRIKSIVTATIAERPQEVAIEGIRVLNARLGYRDLLNQLLQFLFSFASAGAESSAPDHGGQPLTLSFDVFERIWVAVVQQGISQSEVDCVFNCMRRIFASQPKRPPKPTAIATMRAKYPLCSQETLRLIFERLLSTFFASELYSDAAHTCLERLFLVINSYDEKLYETTKQDKQASMVLVRPLVEVHYWRTFFDVALSCRSEAVATKALAHFSSLPQKLSASIAQAGGKAEGRRLLLECCMSELEATRGRKQLRLAPSTVLTPDQLKQENVRLKRCLLALVGILDESAYDARTVVRPHTSLSSSSSLSGGKVTFKLSVQAFPALQGTSIVMSVGDGVSDLVERLESLLGKQRHELKIMNRAKDLVDMCSKQLLISQVPNIGDTENLMIVVKNAAAVAAATAATTARQQRADTATVVMSSTVTPAAIDEERDDFIGELNDLAATTGSSPANVVDPAIWAAQLPALIIAQKREYYELLFDLLESTDEPSICDTLWLLLNRLPTYSSGLHNWVHLASAEEAVTVSSMLFSECGVGSADGLNIAKLFYNLQIIDFLLQPVDSVEKWDQLATKPFPDISSEQLSSWPSIFAARGGLRAIQEALQVLSRNLGCAVADSQGSTIFRQNGCSLTMFLSAVRLSAKLVRAFNVKLVDAYSVASAHLRKLVVSVRKEDRGLSTVNDSAKSSTVPVAAAAPVVIGPQLPPHMQGYQHQQAPQAIPADDTVASQTSAPPEDVSGEWGWRLGPSPIDWDTLTQSSDAAVATQQAIFAMFYCLRFIARDQLFGLKTESCSVTERLAAQSKHDLIICILQDLLVVWACTLTSHPAIIELLWAGNGQDADLSWPANVDPIDLSKFVKQAIIGDFSSLTSSGDFIGGSLDGGIKSLGDRLSKWFIVAMGLVTDLMADIDESDSKYWSHKLKETLLITMLDSRPKLVTGNVINVVRDPTAGSSLTFSAMLTFSSKLVDWKDNPPSSRLLRSERRLAVCLSICEDLRAAAAIYGSNGLVNPQHLESVLHLLNALCRGRSKVLRALYDQQLLVFLLQGCLGHQLPSSAADDQPPQTLCRTAESRTAAYTLIKSFCEWRESALVETLLYFEASHGAASIPSQFHYDPQGEERSPSGYVGLRNLGCTCYMNCLLQVVYHTREIRDFFIQQPALVYASVEDMKNDIVLQLQKLFLGLTLSTSKAYKPDDWIYAYKDTATGLPIKTGVQQDSQEFFGNLCDRVQAALGHRLQTLHGSDGDASSSHVAKSEIFQNVLGGVWSYQLVNNSSGEVRETKRENFVCASMDIIGLDSLTASLQRLVHGEQISEYKWEDDQPRVTITKKPCFASLSNNLVFHLKRFDINFETCLRYKLNSKFSFPDTIDMRPYSLDGIMGTTDPNRGPDYYQYRLKSVIIHSGTAEGGHYYSYIKVPSPDTAEGYRWLEFNDATVKDFSEQLIPQECFGGSQEVNEVILSTKETFQSVHEIERSAYMVVYERVTPLLSESLLESPPLPPSSSLPSVMPPPPPPPPSPLPHKEDISFVAKHIEAIRIENRLQKIAMRILSPEHMSFLSSALQLLRQYFTRNTTGSSASPSVPIEQSTNVTAQKYYGHIVGAAAADALRLFARSGHLMISKVLMDEVLACLKALPVAADSGDDFILEYVENSKDLSPRTVRKPKPPLTEEEQEAQAIALSLQEMSSIVMEINGVEATDDQESYVSDPASCVLFACGLISQDHEVSSDVSLFAMRALIDHFEQLIIGNIFAFELDVREKSGAIILEVVKHYFQSSAYNWEKVASLWFTLANAKKIISNRLSDAFRQDELDRKRASMLLTDEDQINFALEMSARQDLQQQEREASRVVYPPDVEPIMLRFQLLLKLTDTATLQRIPENWRRADAMTALLLGLVNCHEGIRYLFSAREILAGMVDIFLSEQSPFIGELYEKKDHKYAPSSYQVVYPINAAGELCAASKNIPDWTNLLAIVAALCPLELRHVRLWSDFDRRAILQCKVFYNTCLRQTRYIPQLTSIITSLAKLGPSIIGETILESLELVTLETAAPIFAAMDAFVSAKDNIWHERFVQIFSSTSTAQYNLLHFLSPANNQNLTEARIKLLCVCTRSLIKIWDKLAATYASAANLLTQKKEQWAPTMMWAVLQLISRTSNDSANANATTAASTAATAAARGPYLLVYGESIEEAESMWSTRAESTNRELRAFIEQRLRLGNADFLLRADAFTSATGDDDFLPALIMPDGSGESKMTSDYIDMDDEALTKALEDGTFGF